MGGEDREATERQEQVSPNWPKIIHIGSYVLAFGIVAAAVWHNAYLPPGESGHLITIGSLAFLITFAGRTLRDRLSK
jgi:uncharacterized protein involved in response to NO